MAGLLDLMQDPSFRLGLGLLGASGPMPASQSGFGQRLNMAVGGFDQWSKEQQDRKLKEEEIRQQMMLRDMQIKQLIDQAKQHEIMRKAGGAAYQTPLGEANSTVVGQTGNLSPTTANANLQSELMKTATGGINADSFLREAMAAGADPLAATQVAQGLRKAITPPIHLKEGEGLYDPKTYKPLAERPKQQDKWVDIGQNDRGQLLQRNERTGETKAVGQGPLIGSISVNAADKAWMAPITKTIESSYNEAQGAVSSIGTLKRMASALSTGNVNVGPGATFSQFAGQLAQKAGMAGATEIERLTNTRSLIQSTAQLSLEASKFLNGQGQVSNYERQSVEKAASGGIDSMTIPEFNALISALEKVHRHKITSHQERIKNIPQEMGNLGQFFNVQLPSPIDMPNISTSPQVAPSRPINKPIEWGR